MKRWLGIASVVLLLIWAPFAYRELSASVPEVEDDDSAFDEGQDPEVEDDEAEEPGEQPVLPDEAPLAEGAEADEGVEADDEAAEPAAEGDQEGGAQDPSAPGSPGSPGSPAAVVAQALATLIKTFESEPRDSLWAADAEGRIRGLVAGAELAEGQVMELVELDCRRTICRGQFELGQQAEAAEDEEGEDPADEADEPPADEPAEEPRAELSLSELLADYRGRMFEHPATTKPDERKVAVYLIREGYTIDDIKK